MRHELLRIQNLNKSYSSQQIFKNLSLNIFEGESVGLLIPPLSGKTTLANILRGRETFRGTAFFRDEPVDGSFRRYNASGEIVCILKGSRLFPDLSVSENMFIASSSAGMLSYVRHRDINRMTAEYLGRLGICVAPEQKARSLDTFTQHMILLAGALKRGAKLVVFDDSVESYGPENMGTLIRIIRSLSQSGIATLWLTSGYGSVLRTLDRVVVIHDFQKIRTIYSPSSYCREDIQNMQNADVRSPSHSALSNIIQNRGSSKLESHDPPALCLSGVSCGKLSGIDLTLRPGEAVGVTASDVVFLQDFSELFTGTDSVVAGAAAVCGETVTCVGGLRGYGQNFFVLKDAFASDQIFEQFSLFDNVYIPVCSSHNSTMLSANFGLKKALQQEIEAVFGLDMRAQSRPLGSFDINTRQNVVLFRLILQRPAFIVYFSPFAHTDYSSWQLYQKYFNLYKQAGIGLVIISPQLEPFSELLDHAYKLCPAQSDATIISMCRVGDSVP